MLKKSFYVFLGVLIPVIILTSYLIFTKESAIVKPSALSSEDASQTQQLVKNIIGEFASQQTFVDIRLKQSDIDAIAAVASHTIPSSAFESRLSQFGLLIMASKEVSFFSVPLFVNLQCFFTPSFEKFEFDVCYIGDLPVAGVVANWMLENITFLLFGTDVQKTAITLLANAELKDDEIRLSAKKSSDFSLKLNDSVTDVVKLATQFNRVDLVNPARVSFYLEYLQNIPHESDSLAFYMQNLFSSSIRNEKDFDRASENAAIIWALAIHFSNPQFSRAIGLEPDYNSRSIVATKLGGRKDLSLHFLYSMILEQLGETEIGLSIGEFKEILDKSKGGSGFSFADLAADKAGLFFSKYARENDAFAKRLSEVMASSTDESVFFPFVHDLPEGLRERDFARLFSDLTSDQYEALELKIDKRIGSLLIYKNNEIPAKFAEPKPFQVSDIEGNWYKVDTHIHSRFSDGASDIMTIANKAKEFGCAAIAITDHGDNDLKQVLSDAYFEDINQATVAFPGLTIMPGLEWNVPPFRGREHATVLFPLNSNIERNLKAFRQRYDSYKLWQKTNYEAKDAFEWVNRNLSSDVTKPVIIYNHPSRKVWQTAENKHDLAEWSKFSDSIIGFSGAPGHQKKRGDDNGSYELVQKTVHGWDPSIAKIGGEWDQLLSEGKLVYAARAASDFHNTGMDYWPCEFSSTHVKAKSNAHNDILTAFHSGNFWAQHGKFVNNISFKVLDEAYNSIALQGQSRMLTKGMPIVVELKVKLNTLDWQGYKSSLDEVELVVIDHEGAKPQFFIPEMYQDNGGFTFTYRQNMPSGHISFRWRGRSIQPEKHHYMFYSNPIMLIAN